MNKRGTTTGIRISALAGGVGGAKLANGLKEAMANPEDLSVIVNTADDFEHLGFRISPDLDTVCYTLAGLSNPVTGWGRKDETWKFMQQAKEQGLPDWFNIGDKDRLTHLERTGRLEKGETLTQVTRSLCEKWGINVNVLPMSDDPVSTIVDTVEYGRLGFQEYFVFHRCEPAVKGFQFKGASEAQPSPAVIESIQHADLILFCPSNPWVSLDPILSIAGITQSITDKIVVAVSPIVGGKAIKGPAAKMFRELGIEPSAFQVARHYRELLNGMVIDNIDKNESEAIEKLGFPCLVTDTIMKNPAEQTELAHQVIEFGRKIGA